MNTLSLNPGNFPVGNYMSVESVINYFLKQERLTLVDIIRNHCNTNVGWNGGAFNLYYNTQDIKCVMMPDLFKELECDVITYMVTEE
jgi:hypothetical protein